MASPDSEPAQSLAVHADCDPAYRVVVIGASAGGIPALIALLSPLPADFPLPILVVQHLSARMPSSLPKVLAWRTRLAVAWAEDGDALRPGTVLVAPPDRHLCLTAEDRIGLSAAPRRGWWRPAVDTLFQSAAEHCGPRTIAIVLSGTMWDGAKGIESVVAAGGITIAQDEASSGHFDMPSAAIDLGRADVVLPPAKIAEALQVLAAGPWHDETVPG